MVYAFNSRTREAVRGQSGLQSKCQDSQGHTDKRCLLGRVFGMCHTPLEEFRRNLVTYVLTKRPKRHREKVTGPWAYGVYFSSDFLAERMNLRSLLPWRHRYH